MWPATLPAYHGPVFGGGSITLFHIRGIRIAVDWSWFLILFLVIFWMSNFYDELLGPSAGSATPFVLAVALNAFNLPGVGNLPAKFVSSIFGFYLSVVFSVTLGLAIFKASDRLQLFKS